MTIVKTKVQAGRVEFAVPGDWPNGLEVEIRPVATSTAIDNDMMIPDEIAKTLASMRAYQSMEESPDIHQATEDMIKERKQREKADFLNHLERLKKGWE
ncbi:MAG: hypothetical protein QM703_30005 [Gemmatales bacterium]